MALGRPWRRGTLRGRRGTISHPRSFCVAGVAQTHIYHRFAWQAWHWWHWVARLVLVWSPVTPRHFAWQAWHILTSTFVLRGRRGTNSHLPSFCVGLVARDAAALCVAGVAQSHIHVRFAWQAWHKLTSTIVLRGRRPTDGTGWRAWSWLGRPWRRGTLRGRRGTISHPRSFSVAGVAQPHSYCVTIEHPPSFRVAGVAFMALCRSSAWDGLVVSRGRRGAISQLTHHLSQNFVAYHLSHTQLCHAPSFPHNSVTHNFVTHNLVTHNSTTTTATTSQSSHSKMRSYAPSFPHNFVTHNSTTTTTTTSQSS